MAIFKCKMCGGALEINNNETVATCEYCGTQQTLPKLDDDRKANLYDRANHFRRNNEFDKAMGIYEQILNEDNSDAESYWSLVLCRYGIEYVEDPSSHKRVPTVNRAQFTSVFDDEDYKSALKYADGFQKEVYEAEAKVINEIQKGILAISQQEEPFDVFICYKETDSNGRRTQDSVIATELYHELTREGYKVFFSRITLEDKLGTAYEPYIFAALNSSKVMVVLGTKPEYFNAVWVKNEWSRYLSLIKNGEKKILIPAYRDMDPYDLPEEFSHLQAQDMTKLGFMQDLIRGIKKIAEADTPKTTVVKETVISGGNANTAPLLKRAFMFLEDGDWNFANEYCEKVLDIDPENASAYLGKLMAELHVKKQDRLEEQAEPFDRSNNYQKAVRFADEKLKTALTGYIEHINTRNENARLEGVYKDAVNKMNSAKTESDYKKASDIFKSISTYKDSEKRAADCIEKAEIARKDDILNEAKKLMEIQYIGSIEDALTHLKSIPEWKNADELIIACQEKIIKLNEDNEKAKIIETERKKKMKNLTMTSLTVLFIIISFVLVLNSFIIPTIKYNNALKLMDNNSYNEAIVIFDTLDGFKDSFEKIRECENGIIEINYNTAINLMNEGKYEDAIVVFESLNEYKDSKNKINECNDNILNEKYLNAIALMNEEKYIDAINIFSELGEFSDSKEKLSECMKILIDNSKSFQKLISCGWDHIIGLKSDGTVIATGSNEYGQCNVSEWSDIIAVSAGGWHTVGLKSNGTVIAVGDNENGQCNVSEWSDIIAISAYERSTVGLKSDGTVVAVGCDVYGKFYSVSGFSEIIDIDSCSSYAVGLNADRKVIFPQDVKRYKDCEKWTEIEAVSLGLNHLTGLKSDGTVFVLGKNNYGECNVNEWKNIVQIEAGGNFTLGLKMDGTVIVTGAGDNIKISDWSRALNSLTDVIAIDTYVGNIIFLKKDGTVIAVGDNEYGQCNVSDWDLF